MWNEMSCWVVDWEALGAIATASAAAIALGFGLRDVCIRNASRRLRLKVAARLLQTELDQMTSTLEGFQEMSRSMFDETIDEPELKEMEQVLNAPVLNSYLANADSLSEEVAVAIADVIAITGSYRSAILAKNSDQLKASLSAPRTNFKAFQKAAETLRDHLKKYHEIEPPPSATAV